MLNIGIIGCGVVGEALRIWLNNTQHNLFISDPNKGYNDDLSNIDLAFLQIHLPTEEDGTQDLSVIKEIISNLPDVPVFIRTTILPGTSELLSKETNHRVYYMPEFLSERTSIEDFNNQTLAFTGEVELLKEVFKGRNYIVMTPLEAELTKYIHNVFGAYKVTYFNACYDYCKSLGVDWNNIHKGVLLSGYINDTHTYVPGPDGKFGYGGKCFPKDVNAFAKMTEGTLLGVLLKPISMLNEIFRSNKSVTQIEN